MLIPSIAAAAPFPSVSFRSAAANTADPAPILPGISTGFAALDSLTGYAGFPSSGITLMRSIAKSGSESVLHRWIAQAQRRSQRPVMLVEAMGHTPALHLAQQGVSFAALQRVELTNPEQVFHLAASLARLERPSALVIGPLSPSAIGDARSMHSLRAALQSTQCSLVMHLEGEGSTHLRWLDYADLALDFRREQAIPLNGRVVGHMAAVWVTHSNRGTTGRACRLAFAAETD